MELSLYDGIINRLKGKTFPISSLTLYGTMAITINYERMVSTLNYTIWIDFADWLSVIN